MRILVATPLYPPEPGGPATYAKLLEDGLPRFGFEVEVLKFSQVRHLESGFRHIAFFWHAWRAAWRSDLVFALDPLSVGLPAMLAAKLAFRPFAVKVVGDFAWEQGRQRFGITQSLDQFVETRSIPFALRPLRFLQSLVARSARLCIVPSHYLERIVAEWGVPRQNISVIWNAVAVADASRAPERVTMLPPPRIVAVGRLVPWKGFFELIEAVQILRNSKIYASLAIIGEGPDRAELEEKAKMLKQGYAIVGALSHQETLAAMKTADVFVLDSTYEGLSHTLIEALALGIASVASNIGGNREVIEHEKNGLLVAPESPSALAEAIGRLLQDAALRDSLKKKAIAANDVFSKEATLQKTAAALSALLT